MFKGLLKDLDGHTLIIVNKGAKDKPMLVSAAAKRGLDGKYVSYNYGVFERHFLQEVKRLKTTDLLPQSSDDTTETDISSVEGELAGVEHNIATARKRVGTPKDFDGLLDLLHTLDQQRLALVEELDRLQRQQHQPTDKEALATTKSITDLLATTDDPTDLRIRLRAQIRRLVARIQFQAGTAFLDGRVWRYAVVRVFFHSGGERWILTAYNRSGKEECDSWGEVEDGIKHFTPDTLAARLGLLPSKVTVTRHPTSR